MFQILIYEISDLDDHLFPYEYFHMRASLVAQMVKNPPVAPRFDTWVGKIPWRRKWQPTPVFLPGEFQGQRSLVNYSPWGCTWGRKESDTTE